MEKGSAAEGPPARKLIEEGFRFLEERKYHQAIRSFEGALSLVPESALAQEGLARSHAGIGVEFTNSGEPSQAREAFERALRHAEDPLARFGLGYLDFLDLRDGPARDNLVRSLAKEPDDPRAYKLLALIEYRRGDTGAALRLIERSARLDPKDEESEAFLKRWTIEEKLSGSLSESSTRHFVVRYDKIVHPEGMREILAALEEIYDSIGQGLGHWPRKQVPVLLLAEEDFYRATGSLHWVGGVYDGQIKVPVRKEDGLPGVRREALLKTLRHEFTHVVVKELCPGTPNWLNEGIAQYFELGDAAEPGDRSGSELADRKERIRKELKALRDRRIPLEKVPPRMWEISDQAVARLTYLEGLGFVSWLVEKHRAFRLRLLLSAYRREGSLPRAFQSTYGASLSTLESRWLESLESKGGSAQEKSGKAP